MRRSSPLRRLTPLCARRPLRFRAVSGRPTPRSRPAQPARPAPEDLRCAYCGGTFHRFRRTGKLPDPAFCCRRCARFYREEHAIPPPAPPTHSAPWWVSLRRAVRVRDRFRCVLCGVSETVLGHELSVDHIYPRRAFQRAIDVYREFGLAGFVSVCPRCHSRKTSGAEMRWLRGDALELARYIRSVTTPPRA